VEEKNTEKIRICVDFCNLNKATPKDEYLMQVADVLINRSSGHKIISFLDGNVGYNQIFMVGRTYLKQLLHDQGLLVCLSG
jgi:hypothetical protein